MHRSHRCADEKISHLSRYERAGKTRGHDQRHGLCLQYLSRDGAGRSGTDAGLDEPIRAIPLLTNMAADAGDGRNTIRSEPTSNGPEFPASRGKNGDGVHRRSREGLPRANG